jgi:acetyl-CoA/propionyl-CoA carboxylase biotin carboxyl carrier protein
METGAAILPAYDSLIAKLVTRGRDRVEAIARMERALADFEIDGVATTIAFHQNVLANPVFRAGEATTAFLTEHPEVLPVAASTPPTTEAAPAAAGARELLVEVNGRRLVVRVHDADQGRDRAATSPRAAPPRVKRSGPSQGGAANGQVLTSPIQGTVVRVAVEPAQTVQAGDLVCVVEAMKMENELVAHRDGTVTAVNVAAGEAVKIGAALATIE